MLRQIANAWRILFMSGRGAKRPPNPDDLTLKQRARWDRIVHAALHLLEHNAYEQIQIREVADAAQVALGTVYRYFASKDVLITEWVRGIVAHKEEDWKDLNAKHRGDPEGQLQEWSRRIAAKLRAMEERGSALGNAFAELPDPNHPARRVMKEHKLRTHKRVVRLCKAAGFPDPAFSANLFTMMLEGAHSCGTCVGMRQIGEHLVQVVDRMVENNRRQRAG